MCLKTHSNCFERKAWSKKNLLNLALAHTVFTNKETRVQCALASIGKFEGHSLEKSLRYWYSEDKSLALYETPSTKAQNKAWINSSLL